jgi:hypothetical protein
LKGFIAEHGRVKGEHDQLKRKMTDSLGEVEMLRNLVQQLKVQQEQFSNTLSTHIWNGNRRKERPALCRHVDAQGAGSRDTGWSVVEA